jgi:hypothetical protein
MATKPHPIKVALEIMDAWLGLPEYVYKATVYRFSHKLPPEMILEAVEIALAKLPEGGERAFKYFCDVCNCMIQEQQIRQSWK